MDALLFLQVLSSCSRSLFAPIARARRNALCDSFCKNSSPALAQILRCASCKIFSPKSRASATGTVFPLATSRWRPQFALYCAGSRTILSRRLATSVPRVSSAISPRTGIMFLLKPARNVLCAPRAFYAQQPARALRPVVRAHPYMDAFAFQILHMPQKAVAQFAHPLFLTCPTKLQMGELAAHGHLAHIFAGFKQFAAASSRLYKNAVSPNASSTISQSQRCWKHPVGFALRDYMVPEAPMFAWLSSSEISRSLTAAV